MSAILIRPESGASENARFRAVSGGKQSAGRTMGEAIDALTADWGDEIRETTVLIQRFAPDSYFAAEQQRRMKDLLQRRDSLTSAERTKLESLIDAGLSDQPSRQLDYHQWDRGSLDGSARRYSPPRRTGAAAIGEG